MNKSQCKLLDNLGEDEVETMSHEKYNILVSPLLHLCSRSSVLCHSYRKMSSFLSQSFLCNASSFTLSPPADHRLYPGVEGRISPDLIRLLPWWELYLQTNK